jgi:hypothetical protein
MLRAYVTPVADVVVAVPPAVAVTAAVAARLSSTAGPIVGPTTTPIASALPWSLVATRFEPAAQSMPSASLYIARSTTIGTGALPTLSTSAPNRRPAASGNSAPTGIVTRVLPPIANVRTAVVPSSKTSVTPTEPAVADVFATRMNVWTFAGPPAAPSARPHFVPVCMTPALLWPSRHSPLAGYHTARSTSTGTPVVEVTMVETAALASAGSSVCTPMVRRLFAATVCMRVITRPSERR